MTQPITEFFIIREEWNRYLLLPEKNPLRMRISPISFSPEGNRMRTEFSQLMKMAPREDDRGSPSTDQTVSAKDIVRTIDFERLFESINIYDVPSVRKLVIIKPILGAFAMTNKFDLRGDRIYQAGLHLAVAPIDYPPEPSELSPVPPQPESKSP